MNENNLTVPMKYRYKDGVLKLKG